VNKQPITKNIDAEPTRLLSFGHAKATTKNRHNVLILQYISKIQERRFYIKIHDEEELTRRAVNAAAVEKDPNDEDELLTDGTLPATIAPLNPTGPDIRIFIVPNPEKGCYLYRLLDTSNTGLSQVACRVLLEADETALALLAITNSLMSIMKRHSNALIERRYGFASRIEAVRSRKRLKIELVVSDSDLDSLGQIVTATENESILNSLPLTQDDRRLWDAVRQQTHRFDVSWKHIAATDPIITNMRRWADDRLSIVARSGFRRLIPAQRQAAAAA
jgi:hypothetical protein